MGTCPVTRWYEKLSGKTQGRLGRFMDTVQTLDQLHEPHFKSFQNLTEARFPSEKIQYRIFCDTKVGRDIRFLCGCTHKEDQYQPRDAYNTAERRWKEIKEGRANVREFRI
jgi:hypothetical protein